jgi:hypothetical protein
MSKVIILGQIGNKDTSPLQILLHNSLKFSGPFSALALAAFKVVGMHNVK